MSTFETDVEIPTIIKELTDSRLLVRIVEGDIIAMGAKYHLNARLN